MDIFDKYLTGTEEVPSSSATGDTSIYDKYLSSPAEIAASRVKSSVVGKTPGTTVEEASSGMKQGLMDVLNAGGRGIGFVEEKLGVLGGKERSEAFKGRVAKENKAFETDLGQSTGAAIGRTAGQVIATAPIVPARAIQGIKAGMGALPTITSTGERVAAPLINRLSAAVNTGALGGGIFGAATSTANDKSLGENVLEGAATGAVANPLFTAAGALGSAVGKSMWGNINIEKIARSQNLQPSAVKNIIARLDEAGITPQQAQAELTRMGSKATIADLDPSLVTEASGLAALGGTPTSLLKNRFEARKETADNSAQQIMESKIGGAPNKEAAKERIKEDARREVDPDYKAAYASGQSIDISSVVKNIDDQLVNAVGPKASGLRKLKSYLFRDDGQGGQQLKNDIPALHEVRQAIDDVIEKAESPVTSAGKNALNALENVRKGIDAQLKTNPQMAVADTKFAAKMDAANGLDFGYSALDTKGKKSNYLDFERVFSNVSPETQQAIKNGMHAQLGDLMETAQRGELAGAQRLFAKNSANRAKFKLVFGHDADEVLDALAKEGSFRQTENAVMHGSQTAERLAVQSRYGPRAATPGSAFGETMTGIVGDISMGAPALSAINLVKRGGGSALSRLTTFKTDNLTSGSADILSRQGVERDTALDVMKRVQVVQSNMRKPSERSLVRLPVVLPAAGGERFKETN